MTRRFWSACLGAATLAGAFGVSHRAVAKPPDLPLNEKITVSPQAAPTSDRQSLAGDYAAPSTAGAQVIYGGGVLVYPGESPKEIQKAAAEDLLFVLRVYDALPAALPTPTLYKLRPTARRTLAGSLLFSFNPLLALLPTDKALDAPHDHPQCVAGEDVLSDIPVPVLEERTVFTRSGSIRPYVTNEGDWLKWLVAHWTIRHAAPKPEQNEGYINTIHPVITIAAVSPEEAPAEIDAPLVPTAEALPMPKEDKPHKKHKKHKKHHIQRERLPMPQEDTADGVTCPFLRQQAADRHACQFADPQIGGDVLANLDHLKTADRLIEVAEEFAQAGQFDEAAECCALAADLCPGSPCAARAETVQMEMYVRACESAGTPDLAEENRSKPGVQQQVAGLMKACRLLMNEGQHEQAAELARQAFALDPERVMADPLIYKMHLLGAPSHPGGASETSEPPSCPYCPSAGKPIPGVVPNRKKDQPQPTTFLVPPMPPVDYEVVPALERVLTEKTAAAGAEEASEEVSSTGLDELIEAMMGGPGRSEVGFGINADGSLRLFVEQTCGGNVYHVLFNRGCLAVWKTPDAARTKP